MLPVYPPVYAILSAYYRAGDMGLVTGNESGTLDSKIPEGNQDKPS